MLGWMIRMQITGYKLGNCTDYVQKRGDMQIFKPIFIKNMRIFLNMLYKYQVMRYLWNEIQTCIFMNIQKQIRQFEYTNQNDTNQNIPKLFKFYIYKCILAAPFHYILKYKFGICNAKECESKISTVLFFEKSSFLAYSWRREGFLKIREFWRGINRLKPLVLSAFDIKKSASEKRQFWKFQLGKNVLYSAKCKKSVLSSALQAGYWGYPTTYF